MSEETEVKKEFVTGKIVTAFRKGAQRIDDYIKEHTDDPDEKLVADIILDVFEDIADLPFVPNLLGKITDFATTRFRKRFDIPDNDSGSVG